MTFTVTRASRNRLRSQLVGGIPASRKLTRPAAAPAPGATPPIS